MVCQAQRYTVDEAMRCNPATDARRQRLGAFVDAQYRRTDGVWMHTVPPAQGVAWRANVASPRTTLFSLMYASVDRTPKEVRSRWALGEGPCAPDRTTIQNRVCVASAVHGEAPFQALHPWVGGDFNPFELLDECPSSTAATSLCPCDCAPRTSCDSSTAATSSSGGASNGSFYSAAFMAAEFPQRPNCVNEAFPRFRVMDATDESNLCAFMTASSASSTTTTSSSCTHTQGLFGGAQDGGRSVTADELHAPDGAATFASDFLVQELLDVEQNGLWCVAARALLC